MRSIRNCNVCVIGGAGFLGSHCVDHLINDRACAVTVIDNLVSGRREFVHPKANFIHADITKSEAFLLNVFRRNDIRYVLNYAAWPYIPDSFDRPLHVFEVNANGALAVMNAAQEAGCIGVLQISSAEIYGDSQLTDGMLDEGSPVVPHSTYGAAKAAIDSLVQVRWREAQTPCIALRQFNCVGERETHPYVIPEIIGQLSQRSTVRLGNNSSRDFLYAGDQARMAVELLERGKFGEYYNLGSETGIQIYDLAKLIGKLMGLADVRVEPDPARIRPWEIWALRSNNAKIYSVIDARPQVPLEEALRRTIDDFRANGKWCWQ